MASSLSLSTLVQAHFSLSLSLPPLLSCSWSLIIVLLWCCLLVTKESEDEYVMSKRKMHYQIECQQEMKMHKTYFAVTDDDVYCRLRTKDTEK